MTTDPTEAAERAYSTLREANVARQSAWANGDAVSLLFRATELGGETGEVLNVVKKIERERQGWRGSRATTQDLADELADVVICADLLALTEGIDLDAAVARKFNATSEKVSLPHRLDLSSHSALTARVGELEAALKETLRMVGQYAPNGIERSRRYRDVERALTAGAPTDGH